MLERTVRHWTLAEQNAEMSDLFFIMLGSINQSINQSVSQSVSQSVNQSTNQSISQVVNQSINQSVSQSVNQSTNQSISQLVNQSINQSTNKPTNQSTNQSINQSFYLQLYVTSSEQNVCSKYVRAKYNIKSKSLDISVKSTKIQMQYKFTSILSRLLFSYWLRYSLSIVL